MKRRSRIVLLVVGVGVLGGSLWLTFEFLANNGAWPIRGTASRLSDVPLMSEIKDFDRATEVEYVYRTKWRYNEVHVTAVLPEAVLEEGLIAHPDWTVWNESHPEPPGEIAITMNDFDHSASRWSEHCWEIWGDSDAQTSVSLGYNPESGRLWGVVRRQHSVSGH